LSLFVAFASFLLIGLAACGGGGGSSIGTPNPPAPGSGDQMNNDPAGELPVIELLPPGTALSPGDVAGVIKDALGTPLEDVEVALDDQPISAMTDSQGVFLIQDVAPGSHELHFGKDGHVFFTTSIDVDGDTPVNLAFSSSDARLASQDSPDFARMHGRVFVAGTDEPVPGAWVIVFDMDGFFRATQSGDLGGYEFDRLPPGHKFVLGFKRGFQVFFGEVELEAGGNREFNIPLHRINVGNVEGRVTSTNGEAIGHAAVFLLSYRGDDYGPRFQTYTNDNGFYRFVEVPAGPADMLAAHPRFHPGSAFVEVIANDTIERNFVLEPKDGQSGQHVILEGLVKNGEGHPIAGAHIRLTDEAGHVWETMSGEKGGFRFELPHTGGYWIRVAKDGYRVFEGDLNLHEGVNEITVTLFANEPGGFGSLSGSVHYRGEDGGEPPAVEAHLVVFGANNDEVLGETWTNQEGEYAFHEIPAGVYHVRCEFGEFDPLTAEVEIRAGQKTIKNFFFEREQHGEFASLWAVVRDQHGEPIAEAFVKVFRNNLEGEVVRSGYTNGDGVIHFEEVPAPGTYAVKAFKWERHSNVETVQLAPGDDKEVHLTIERPAEQGWASLFVIVRDQFGNPVPEALVKLWKVNYEQPFRSGYTNGDGVIHFVELPAPQGYYAKAFKWERQSNLEDIFLEPGEEGELHLVIEAPQGGGPGWIFGHVYDDHSREPIAGATVVLFHNEQAIADTTTGEAGGYEFGDLEPGFYALKFMKDGYETRWIYENQVFAGEGTEVDAYLVPLGGGGDNGWIFGHVYDESTEQPISDAHVKVFSGDLLVAETYTGDLGGYEFDAVFEPGFYHMKFFKEGYELEEIFEIQVFAGEGTEVNAFLTPTGGGNDFARLYGHVYNGEEQPLIGAWVKLGFYEGEEFVPVYAAQTGQEGYYVIEEIEPGAYAVLVFAEGYQPFHGEQGFEPGDNIFRNFVLYGVD
jgi:hypothetical protein